MVRTVFLVDGFNLYFGILQAGRDSGGKTTKWLDLRRLCETYLSVVGQVTGDHATLERIHYFSAVPTHRSDGAQKRHALYMRCLRGTGVNVELARFKRKDLRCPICGDAFHKHEEKETDVALAAKLFEVCHAERADAVVLMTGDTDLAPAFRTCARLFPETTIMFAFPYRRTNSELQALAPESFSIKRRTIIGHQFPDPLELRDGTRVSKPPDW
ncbi:MAG: NYN domain-containing protein [Planctomycetota bacterium]